MYSCEGCLANFNRHGNLIQHLEKSTNLLCIDAREAFRVKMWPIKGRWHELSEVDVEDSENSNSDFEEDEGDFVDLDTMPIEVGAEEHIV